MHLSQSIEPAGGRREGGGLRGGRGGGVGRSSKSDDSTRGGFLSFLFEEGEGRLRGGTVRADRVKVPGEDLGNAGVAPIGEKGGLPGGGVGLGKGFGVTVADVLNGVDSREVGIEGGAIIGGRSRGSSLIRGLRGGGDRGQSCLSTLGRG